MASISVEESSGYDSGSEDSVVARLGEQPSMTSSILSSTSLSTSTSFSALGMSIPPLPSSIIIGYRPDSEAARPRHASPDSRPPARLRADHNVAAHGAPASRAQDSLPRPSPRPTVSATGFMADHASSDDLSRRDRVDDVPIQAASLAEYEFPRHRLPIRLRDENMEPLVIVACGSFSPCTYLHLRIFEMAKDVVFEAGKSEILAGYYSPVADAYRKPGLAASHHRVRMCELAVENTSSWLMVDAWESLQSEYTRTADVLDHFDQEINGEGGVMLADGTRKRVKIMLLAGGDLIQSFGEPGVWSEPDLHRILGGYGCLVVERTGSDVWAFLLSHDILWMHRTNVIVIKQLIYNDISSTKVRLFVRRGMSLKYLMPTSVITYIENNHLYVAEFEPVD